MDNMIGGQDGVVVLPPSVGGKALHVSLQNMISRSNYISVAAISILHHIAIAVKRVSCLGQKLLVAKVVSKLFIKPLKCISEVYALVRYQFKGFIMLEIDCSSPDQLNALLLI